MGMGFGIVDCFKSGGRGYVRKGGNRIGDRWGKEEIAGGEKG